MVIGRCRCRLRVTSIRLEDEMVVVVLNASFLLNSFLNVFYSTNISLIIYGKVLRSVCVLSALFRSQGTRAAVIMGIGQVRCEVLGISRILSINFKTYLTRDV